MLFENTLIDKELNVYFFCCYDKDGLWQSVKAFIRSSDLRCKMNEGKNDRIYGILQESGKDMKDR